MPAAHVHDVKFWGRILLVNTLGGLTAFGLLGGLVADAPWSRRSQVLLASLVYANCIGGLAGLVMPRLMHRAAELGRPARWLVRTAGIAIVIVAGCAVAGLVGIAVGFVRPDRYREQLLGSFWISFVVSAVLILVVTAYETLRGQLDATTVALRTKERDEGAARQAATEARLASLESRVNPHFLFNTLNAIASLTHSDPAGAERVTHQLAALMRSSLDSGSTPLVTLDDELKLVRDYLDIEQVRFGGRLRYTIEASGAATRTPVPRLSLQTVVENSVKYAVSPRPEGGSLAIRSSVSNGLTRLTVEDDGPGFNPDRTPSGHGLDLLRSRLEMTFGDRARLDVDSRPGRTTVAIEVPSNHRETSNHKEHEDHKEKPL